MGALGLVTGGGWYEDCHVGRGRRHEDRALPRVNHSCFVRGSGRYEDCYVRRGWRHEDRALPRLNHCSVWVAYGLFFFFRLPHRFRYRNHRRRLKYRSCETCDRQQHQDRYAYSFHQRLMLPLSRMRALKKFANAGIVANVCKIHGPGVSVHFQN